VFILTVMQMHSYIVKNVRDETFTWSDDSGLPVNVSSVPTLLRPHLAPHCSPTLLHLATVALESKETQKSMQKTVTANLATGFGFRRLLRAGSGGRALMLAINRVPDQRK
jgi:hypothetical protein